MARRGLAWLGWEMACTGALALAVGRSGASALSGPARGPIDKVSSWSNINPVAPRAPFQVLAFTALGCNWLLLAAATWLQQLQPASSALSSLAAWLGLAQAARRRGKANTAGQQGTARHSQRSLPSALLLLLPLPPPPDEFS